MYKPFPAPHRVVCKSLLVCDEDEKKAKKKPVKTFLKTEDVGKSVTKISSAQRVPLSNGVNDIYSSSDKYEAQNDNLMRNVSNHERKMSELANNSNGSQGCSAESVKALLKPSSSSLDEVMENILNNQVHHGSTKSDRKERNPPSSLVVKQLSSNDVMPVKPCSVKRPDKKETREYIRKKKLERQEKEQQELLHRKLELESRRQKLMELRDTTLKVLKASIKKRSQPKNNEDLERKWHDLDDDDNLQVPSLTLNSYSDVRNMNGGPSLRYNHELNSLSTQKHNFPSKNRNVQAGDLQKLQSSFSKSSSALPEKRFSSHERPHSPHFETNIPIKQSSCLPDNFVPTLKIQPLCSNNLQSINEVNNQKEYISRLSEEVNRLSSSIQFLKDNASKTLLKTNNLSAKSTSSFDYQTETNRNKQGVSKSCHSIPQEMVNAVSELKDTLTLLSQSSLKPVLSGRVSNSVDRCTVPTLMPPPSIAAMEENHTGTLNNGKHTKVPEENGKAKKLQSVYHRHQTHPKHSHSFKTEEDNQLISNGDSEDHSVSSGLIFGSNGVSVKDTDSEDLSVKWLQSLALKSHPMNFITTLKSKLNLNSHENTHIEKDAKKLRMDKMFDVFNKKFKENLEESLNLENNGETKESSPLNIQFETSAQPDLHLQLPSKITDQRTHQKLADSSLQNNLQQEPKGQGQLASQKSFFNKKSAPKTTKVQKRDSSKNRGSAVHEPSISSHPHDNVFLPLSIAHFPSADELKQSGNSSSRSSKHSSNAQQLANNEKPLTVPKLHLKSNIVSSTDLSSYHSKSNSEVSMPSKDTLSACDLRVPVRLRQVTAADKSSLSSMSDLSESTLEKVDSIENKENELPQFDLKVDDMRKIYNPSILRLQAEAELKQIDLYNESLEQLVEAEHYRDLTLAKEMTDELKARKEEKDKSSSKSRKKSVRSVSTTPSLTEITDTSTIMSELLSLPNMELNQSSFSFKFSPDEAINKQSQQMLEQLLKDEEFWANHQKESLKLREKALLNSIKVGIVWFEVQKKQLKESGQEHLIKNLKKKQRGLLLKLQQEKEEISRLQKTILSASEERRLILLQQYQLVKSQVSAKDALKRKKVESSPTKNLNSSKYLPTKPTDLQFFKSVDATNMVCDKNLGQTLLDGLRALEQEKCKISEREKQLIEHSKNVDELLQWKKKFKDLEKQAGSSRPLRDRSTSPFRMTPEPSVGINAPVGGDPEITRASQVMKKGQEEVEGNQSDNATLSSKGNQETAGIRSVDHYGSESVESPESSETPRTHQSSCNVDVSCAIKNMSVHTKQTSIHIKTPLSPRLQNSRRLRYSSGSDDSMIFSQNETLSEQSETEVRVSALHEQLKQRKLEAERLQREHKRAQRERLKMKEQALIKQIQAYDEFIQKTRRELEQELNQAVTPVVRPQIKQPRVLEKTAFKRQDSVPPSSTSESNDTSARRASVNISLKISQEKHFELEDSHNLEVVEPAEGTEKVIEKERKDFETTEEMELFPSKVCNQEKVYNKEKTESKNSIGKSVNRNRQVLEMPSFIPGLDLRSESEELPEEETVSKAEEEIISKPDEETVTKMLSSSDLNSASKSDAVLSRKNDRQLEVESEVENEIPDSISEISSLRTAQESDRTSAKLIGRLNTAEESEKQGNATSEEQVHSSFAEIPSVAESPVELNADKTSTNKSISSHLRVSPTEVVKPISPIRLDLEEKPVESGHSIQKSSTNDNTDISSHYDKSTEKSIPEICSNSSQSEIEDPAENIHIFEHESSQLQEFPNNISNIGEDWMDADDFFESNFPTTSKVFTNQMHSWSPSDNQEQFKTPSIDKIESSAEINLKLSSAQIAEPNLESDLLNSEQPLKSVLYSHGSEESDEEDVHSKCDSVTSKTSVSSVKVSESGKSYEKDRSLSEVIENCEVSEVLDTSSASNESCKTFDNDFDEIKDVNDIFSNTFIINEETCSSQPQQVSPCVSEVTDRITNAILHNLLQDSFDCIGPLKADSKTLPVETVSLLETPFIEALKRDHEALKVKSQIKNEEDARLPENRNRLYNAISVAEILLGHCLNEATETVLEIRSKIECCDENKIVQENSAIEELPSSKPENDFVPPQDITVPETKVRTSPEKDPVGVGLGDDVDFNQDWLMNEESAQREAEKLRLKQLQIEQEIERLQQAQQQAPYIYERYLREIPNKPPPPYTPPVQPESVPTDENIVLNIVTSAASHIYDSRLIHVEPKPPPNFTSDKNNSLAIYKKFLYDLCLQLINDIYADDLNETAVPWEKTIKCKAKAKVPTNKAMLIEEIKQKVSILFGYRKKVAKENLIIRWSRKKRDHVDELLVREAQEEEQEWTNYEFDEITVKNQVTAALLNGLLHNTTLAISKALQNKLEKLQETEK